MLRFGLRRCRMDNKKIISILLIIILVINIILLATQRIKPLLFWLILGVIALIAYKWVPRVK